MLEIATLIRKKPSRYVDRTFVGFYDWILVLRLSDLIYLFFDIMVCSERLRL